MGLCRVGPCFKSDKLVELVARGCVINGATPSSFSLHMRSERQNAKSAGQQHEVFHQICLHTPAAMFTHSYTSTISLVSTRQIVLWQVQDPMALKPEFQIFSDNNTIAFHQICLHTPAAVFTHSYTSTISPVSTRKLCHHRSKIRWR